MRTIYTIRLSATEREQLMTLMHTHGVASGSRLVRRLITQEYHRVMHGVPPAALPTPTATNPESIEGEDEDAWWEV